MTTHATVKWVDLCKGTPRVTIILRVPHVVSVPHSVDPHTARYTSYRVVTQEREQQAYVWRDSLPGALIASLCERAELAQLPLLVEYEDTPWGWKLTHVDIATQPGPPAGAWADTEEYRNAPTADVQNSRGVSRDRRDADYLGPERRGRPQARAVDSQTRGGLQGAGHARAGRSGSRESDLE